uniref:ATP synthase F(0) complex subunit e, mitochondrial n=1 Tax=Oncorhynchus tshawytscha TaxID=74940 RepID=A0AAZ3QFF6_ONCTS
MLNTVDLIAILPQYLQLALECFENNDYVKHGHDIRTVGQTARYSALLAGIVFGKRRYDELKPIAAEERRIEEEEKKVREEQEKIAKALAEASEESILK